MGARARIVIGVAMSAVVLLAIWVAWQQIRSPGTQGPVAGAEGTRPQPPLRRDGFEQLFQTGRAVRAGGREAVVDVVDVDRLDLPTGHLVATDPTYIDPEKPFVVTVPPGSYPVSLARVRFAAEPEHYRVAAARVLVRADAVTRWDLALTPDDNPAKLGPNQFFGYGVDAGMGAFLDASAGPALARLLGENLDGPLMASHQRDTTMRGVSVRDTVSGLNVITFESGWGDGAYPTWIGYAADGSVAQFVTDFHVIDLP